MLSKNSIVNEIEDSDLTIICLTKNCENSTQFKDEIDLIKVKRKLILPVVIDAESKNIIYSFIQMNSFLVTHSELNQLMMKKFEIFLDRCISLRECHEEFDIQLEVIKEVNNKEFDFEQIIGNEIYLKKHTNCIKLFNVTNGELIFEKYLKSNEFECCIVDHLSQILIIENFNEEVEKIGQVFDKNGQFIREIHFPNYVTSIRYNQKNKKTYLTTVSFTQTEGLVYDENLNFENKTTLLSNSSNHISNNEFIFMSSLESLHIYDLSFKHLAKIQIDSLIYSIFLHPLHPRYLFLDTSSNIRIFNSNNFNFIQFIEIPFKIKSILNDKIIFSDLKQFYYIYSIKMMQKDSIFNEKFACKLNKFNHHLYTNPHLLPCSNSACIDCICENYNIHLNKFKCHFDSCKEWHQLPFELKKNFELVKMMNGNTKKLLKVVLAEIEKNIYTLTGIKFICILIIY